jgi:hypothetical protein
VGIVSTLGLTVLGGAFAVGFVRGWRRSKDATQRETQRAAWLQSKGRKDAAEIVDAVARCFPHAREALRAVLEQGGKPDDVVQRVLDSVPGVLLGETTLAIAGRKVTVPVRWPESQRRLHGYIAGRTGTGKTTLQTICIQAEIAAGRGVAVIGPEHEWFAENLLPLCERRASEVLYFAPGDFSNPLCINPLAVEPGDDPGRCAGEVFEILRRAIGRDGFGARMGPTLANSLAILVGDVSGTTLLDIPRLLHNASFRESLLSRCTDTYALSFWRSIYTTYPRGSSTPLANRLDEVFRSRAVRASLCRAGGFSVREALNKNRILLVDLGRLDPPSQAMIGQVVVSRIQLELLRRENQATTTRETYSLFCDEFQTLLAAESGWREAISRCRRYGLALTAGNQNFSQLSRTLLDEILGNVGALFVFGVGAKDADLVRKELLFDAGNGNGLKPVPTEALVHQRVGSAVARLSGDACAIRLRVAPPVKCLPREIGDRVREVSWKTFGRSAVASSAPPPDMAVCLDEKTVDTPPAVAPLNGAEVRFLRAVAAKPGQPSAEYARKLGLNGTKAAAIRRRLVDLGLVREHTVARKAQGKPALLLESTDKASRALGDTEGGDL